MPSTYDTTGAREYFRRWASVPADLTETDWDAVRDSALELVEQFLVLSAAYNVKWYEMDYSGNEVWARAVARGLGVDSR